MALFLIVSLVLVILFWPSFNPNIQNLQPILQKSISLHEVVATFLFLTQNQSQPSIFLFSKRLLQTYSIWQSSCIGTAHHENPGYHSFRPLTFYLSLVIGLVVVGFYLNWLRLTALIMNPIWSFLNTGYLFSSSLLDCWFLWLLSKLASLLFINYMEAVMHFIPTIIKLRCWILNDSKSPV